MPPTLSWLPLEPHFDDRLAALKRQTDSAEAWRDAESLARTQLDFTQTGRLDRVLERLVTPVHLQTVRVALLASSTTQHLLPSLRVAALRRGLRLQIYTNSYGQYLQELLDSASNLHRFRPEVCCLLLDAHHLAELAEAGPATAIDRMETCWRLCREHFFATVIQQTALPLFDSFLGSNEHRLEGSPSARLLQVNAQLPAAADTAHAALFDVTQLANIFGIDALHDPSLWHLAKQEIHPSAAPAYADQLARVIAAVRGRSAKCLVLDLDNTLWGGVIGDDGLDNIQLGKGHAVGEAFLEFQGYCLGLKSRGITLAVCSKNDERTARAPFREHPSMLLREQDIACFVANWQDKAANLRHIARTLNLGLDALVFADDNPAERALIRQELPEVTVLELPDDPSGFIRCVARSGYFEAVCFTPDDRARAAQYRDNAAREAVRETATDLHSYLAGLQMKAYWSPFAEAGLPRIVQLINKTNQFNLTTPRVSEEQVRAWIHDPCVHTWQLRLTDRFGDNGVVALMAARICRPPSGQATCELTMLLMSCRVLGRRLEEELVRLLVTAAQQAGALKITGVYRPTPKNSMVRDLLQRLGFSAPEAHSDGSLRSSLGLPGFTPGPTEIELLPAMPPRETAQ